jgi:hypothetical protein
MSALPYARWAVVPLIEAVAHSADLSAKALTGLRTYPELNVARYAMWRALNEQTRMSKGEIGRRFGRARRTIESGLRRSMELDDDPEFQQLRDFASARLARIIAAGQALTTTGPDMGRAA